MSPGGALLGCGVTASSQEEAIVFLKEQVFNVLPFPNIKRCIENVELGSLDQNHMIPNMGDHRQIGIWFPLVYNEI